MRFKYLLTEALIVEGNEKTYNIYIDNEALSKNKNKQEFLDCVKELIKMDKFEIEQREAPEFMPFVDHTNSENVKSNLPDKSYTYSKYDVHYIFKTIDVNDFVVRVSNNISKKATGYVWIMRIDDSVIIDKFNSDRKYAVYLKLIFEDDKEPRHSKHSLEPKKGYNYFVVDTMRVKIEFISAHDELEKKYRIRKHYKKY